MASPVTKLFVTQLEVDLEELKVNWGDNRYNKDQEARARGQANYISGILADIRGFVKQDA